MSINQYHMSVEDGRLRGVNMTSPILIRSSKPSAFSEENLNKCAQLAEKYFTLLSLIATINKVNDYDFVVKVIKECEAVIAKILQWEEASGLALYFYT